MYDGLCVREDLIFMKKHKIYVFIIYWVFMYLVLLSYGHIKDGGSIVYFCIIYFLFMMYYIYEDRKSIRNISTIIKYMFVYVII